MTAGQPFLLARLVADQLLAGPVDTSQPDWRDRVSGSIEEAFDTDLAAVSVPVGRDVTEDAGAGIARRLLWALTWGLGAGLPEDEWIAVANSAGTDPGVWRDDLDWVLDQLGRYIVQDGEDRVAVYRLAHQSLADHLRPPFGLSYEQPFDPAAAPVATALLGRYRRLLEDGVPARAAGYLWRYGSRHAALAGPEQLELLRQLARSESDLVPDLAAAALAVASTFRAWGRRQEALAPSEEAVTIYRELAAANPAFVPDLAGALNNVGNRYRDVGRRREALAPAEEAVSLYRETAAANPAFVPDLAMALTNLGGRYSDVGRRQEALALAEEAVLLYREPVAANPAFVPDLASALTNLGVRYSEVGRPHEALAPTEEAASLYRQLAAANPAFVPDLASALTNLGVLYGEVGRPHEALAPAEEAVSLYRQLAAANPAFVPDLARALDQPRRPLRRGGAPPRGARAGRGGGLAAS